MTIHGNWTVRFGAVAGTELRRESGGVVTFREGELFGGDAWAYYTGSYSQVGKTLTLRVDVRIHFTEGGESVLGGPLVPFTLIGQVTVHDDGLKMTGAGHVEGAENAIIAVVFSKVGGDNTQSLASGNHERI
jgi:hypothetical protein